LRALQVITEKRAFALATVCAGALLIIRSSAVTGILVEAISLPESLLKAGFTPVGAADEFPEQMRSVTRDSEWARFVSVPFFSSDGV
jgi:hypothetical protein